MFPRSSLIGSARLIGRIEHTQPSAYDDGRSPFRKRFSPGSSEDFKQREEERRGGLSNLDRFRETTDRARLLSERMRNLERELRQRIEGLRSKRGGRFDAGGEDAFSREIATHETLTAYRTQMGPVLERYARSLEGVNGSDLRAFNDMVERRQQILQEADHILREYEAKAGIESPAPYVSLEQRTSPVSLPEAERTKPPVVRLYPYGWRSGQGTRGGHEHLILSFSTGWGRDQKELGSVSGNQGAMNLGLRQSIMLNNIRHLGPTNQAGTEYDFGAGYREHDEQGDINRALRAMGIDVRQTNDGTQVRITYIPENEYIVIEGEKIWGPIGTKPLPASVVEAQNKPLEDAWPEISQGMRFRTRYDKRHKTMYREVFDGQAWVRDAERSIDEVRGNRPARRLRNVTPSVARTETPPSGEQEVHLPPPEQVVTPVTPSPQPETPETPPEEVMEKELLAAIDQLKRVVAASRDPKKDAQAALQDLGQRLEAFLDEVPAMVERTFQGSVDALLRDRGQQRKFEEIFDQFFSVGERMGGRSGSRRARPQVDWSEIRQHMTQPVSELRGLIEQERGPMKRFLVEEASRKADLKDRRRRSWDLIVNESGTLDLIEARRRSRSETPRVSVRPGTPDPYLAPVPAPRSRAGVSSSPSDTTVAPPSTPSATPLLTLAADQLQSFEDVKKEIARVNSIASLGEQYAQRSGGRKLLDEQVGFEPRFSYLSIEGKGSVVAVLGRTKENKWVVRWSDAPGQWMEPSAFADQIPDQSKNREVILILYDLKVRNMR